MVFRLQYASALFTHTIGGLQITKELLKPAHNASALAILGNAGSFATDRACKNTSSFLNYCLEHWPKVIWIPGPLEYRGPKEHSFKDSLKKMKDIKMNLKDNGKYLHILDNGELYDINKNIVFLGSTGWPRIESDELHEMNTFEKEIRISESQTKFRSSRIKDVRLWNTEDMIWLKERANWWSLHHPTVRIIILTHYLCSPFLISLSTTNLKELQRAITLEYIGSPNKTQEILSTNTLYSWLCGASTGSTISGSIGSVPGIYVHGAVNPLFSGEGTDLSNLKVNTSFDGHHGYLDIPI